MAETRGWDDYWTGSQQGAAFSDEGVNHPVLASFWQDQLAGVNVETVLDVASGRGALREFLPDSYDGDWYAVDFSLAALTDMKDTLATVADVARLPFKPGSFEMVISQFGVEYGGRTALEQLPVQLASGGQLKLMLHCSGSVIDRECRTNRAALQQLDESRFIPLALEMFRQGYGVLKGNVEQSKAQQAAQQVMGPFKSLGTILENYGPSIAGGTVITLYQETARIQQRIQHHVESEVLGWLETMQIEIGRYAARMESMTQAALDEDQFSAVKASYAQAGLSIELDSCLRDEHGQPLGWILTGVQK